MLRPLLALALLVPLLAPPASLAASEPATFLVGFAKRDITPTESVHLGGFGFGPVRPSMGVEYPIHARAVVIGDASGASWVALASVEVQGSFAAYERGAWGWWDVAKEIEAATGGALARDHVLVSSDHSHRGPDTTGAWGGMSDAYMAFIAAQTRDAILDAYAAAAPARLRVASVDAGAFVTSDFPYPTQDTPDPWFRLLVAENLDGDVAGVYGTFSAHATLHGSGGSTPRVSPDWPGVVSDMLAERIGAPAVLGQGAVGRTHPAGSRAVWEDSLTGLLAGAVDGGAYLTDGTVDARVHGVTFVGWNPVLLAALTAGDKPCALPGNPVTDEFTAQSDISPCGPIGRSKQAPWLQGNLIRTLVTGARIGDVFLWGAPGELYPNAHWAIEERVEAREHFIAGLANDQLGYLIAPTEAWPLIVATVASDNGLFNVDATGGDHAMCAALDIAAELEFAVSAAPPVCAAWAAEDRTTPP